MCVLREGARSAQLSLVGTLVGPMVGPHWPGNLAGAQVAAPVPAHLFPPF